MGAGGLTQPRRLRARASAWGEWLWRASAAHPSLSAALLLAAVVLGYLWPVLLGGKILSPGSVLFELAPWKALRPADLTDFYNPLLIDVPVADLPWRAFARELLHAGTLPAWNPHVFAGSPFLTNPQTGLFSVFSVPLWTLPFDYAVGVEAALKLWAAGFGTYLLVRQLGLGLAAGVLAGVAFAFCALNVVWLTHATIPAVAALLPWVVWLVERIVTRGRAADALALALATAIALGGGHPGMQVHLLVGAGLYLLLRLALARHGDDPRRLRVAALAVGGMTLGVLAMGAMLVPEVLSSHGTIGVGARSNGGILPGSQMPLDAIKTVVFPDWWGRPDAFELPEEALRASSAGSQVNYNERTFYAGAVALLLALVGLLSAGHRRAAAPFAVLAAIGLAVALHAPGLHWLATHLPLLSQVQSQRLHFLFAFGVAIGAAFGVQAVLDRPQDARRLAVPLGGVLLALGAFLGAGAPVADLADGLGHLLDAEAVREPGALAVRSIGSFLLLAVGVGCVLAAAVRWPRRRAALAALLVLLAVADAYHFTSGYQPMARSSAVNPPATPAIRYLRAHADEGRFAGLGLAMIGEPGMRYGLHDVRGYSSPQPSERFYRLWRRARPDQTPWQAFEIDDLRPAAIRVVSVLGARWILTDLDVAVPPLRDRALEPLRIVYVGRDAIIFENPNALPRTFVAPAVVRTASAAATRDALLARGFAPREAVVVEQSEIGGELPGPGGDPRGRVRIVDERNARVTLQATLSRRGLVVLADRFTDGWRVAVDGTPAPALIVDDVLRGVVVGPGSHEIVWSYSVPGLRAGIAMSGGALLIGLACAVALLLRRRRVKAATAPA